MNLKNKKMAQSGRTMTELLGSLAVMGLLGVGTISAFTAVMNRFRANNLLDEAGGRAIYLTAQFEKGRKNVTLGKFTTNDVIGGVFSQSVFTSGLSGQFGIQVSDVNKAVCERLLNSIEDTTPLRRLSLVNSPTVAITECNDENTFLMIYNAKVKGSESDTSYHCESDADCDTICATCNENNQCVGECELPVPDINEYGQECGTNECIRYDEETQTCKMACERVEYLESTGGPWINTELLSTENSQVDVTFSLSTTQTAPSNNGAIFGGRNTQQQNTFTLFYIASTTPQYFRFDYQGQRAVGTKDTDFPFDTERKFRFTANSSKATTTDLTTNQSKTITYSKATTFTTTPIILFAANTQGNNSADIGTVNTYFKGRIYEYVYSDGLNSIHLIPVIAPDGEPCMFDKISQKLFCNSGSGDFQTNLDE